MRAIVDYQKDYFMDGDDTKLRPMVLKDIAQQQTDGSFLEKIATTLYYTPKLIFLIAGYSSNIIKLIFTVTSIMLMPSIYFLLF